MSLKRQLFIASLLMLLIPWAGLKFVLELDTALRDQASQQLDNQAKRLADLAGDQLVGIPPVTSDTPILYVTPVDQPMELDGYAADWPGYDENGSAQYWQTASESGPGTPTLKWQAASEGQYLYLLLRLGHPTSFYNPGSPEQPHDRVQLWLQPSAVRVDAASERDGWLLRPSAPGELYALREPRPYRPDYRIKGAWQAVAGGWQLELQMPLPAAYSRLGFEARWGPSIASGTGTSPLPVVFQPDAALERALFRQLSAGQQARIIEPAGWVIADTDRPTDTPSPDFDSLSPMQVIEQISLNALRQLIQFYQPDPEQIDTGERQLQTAQLPTEGLVRHPDGSRWLLTTQSLFGGRTLVLEQSIDQLLSLSGSTLGSVIARSTLIIVSLTLVLLGYASWLSWRITRLQKLVNDTVDEDGRITGTLPQPRTGDELGQLQAHFGQMVQRLHGYNRYLESFSRRLSHELKTPVAVVRSSLENLGHAESDEERQQYLDRASTATQRLQQILHGMSEAARLEQSFDHADKEPFDLAEVAAEATSAYQSLDPGHVIRYQGPNQGCPMLGSPEHMVQLLDKLVDNARDFTPRQGLIEVALKSVPGQLELSVFNEGSQLPGGDSADIFGAFISHRDGNGEGHLGQGLLIVRLIADYHGGRVEAANESLGRIDGVRFRVIIPNTPT